MMMILHFNPFDTFSRLDILDYDNTSVSSLHIHSLLSNGIEELVDVAYSKNNFNITFNGPTEFLPEVSSKVREIENTKYSVNKIKIEGVY